MSDGADSTAVASAKAALAACDFGEQVRAIDSVLVGQTLPTEAPPSVAGAHAAMIDAWAEWSAAVASVGE